MLAKHRQTLFGMADKEFAADGVVTGGGTVLGRPVYVASQDFTVAGGSAGEVHSDKVAAAMHDSLTTGSPFVFINDSGGARVQEGIDSLGAYGRVFYSNVLLSGVVPQLSIIAWPVRGRCGLLPGADRLHHPDQARPHVHHRAERDRPGDGEKIDADTLGGADAHMSQSGVVHFVVDGDEQGDPAGQEAAQLFAAEQLRRPADRRPGRCRRTQPELDEIIDVNPMKGYDVRDVITRAVDHADFLEVQAGYAMNIVIGFGRTTAAASG